MESDVRREGLSSKGKQPRLNTKDFKFKLSEKTVLG